MTGYRFWKSGGDVDRGQDSAGGMRKRRIAGRLQAEAMNPASRYGVFGAGGIHGSPAKALRIAVKTLTVCLRAVDR